MSSACWYRGVVGVLMTSLVAATVGYYSARGLADEPPASRAPVPPAERQAVLRQHLEEGLKLSEATTTGKRHAALKQMLPLIDASETPPDELYVLIESALPLIRERNDAATLRTVVDKYADSFEVDGVKERLRLFGQFIAETKSRSAFDTVVKEILQVADQMAARNDYPELRRVLSETEVGAQRIGSKTSLTLIERTRARLVEREAAYGEFQRARRTLESSPEDPSARFKAGYWVAVFEKDWSAALPLLAAGGDSNWRTAAAQELRAATEPEAVLTVADAWWDAAQSAEGPAKSALQDHALDWYERVDVQELTPLLRTRSARRRSDLYTALKRSPPAPAAAVVAAAPKADGPERLPAGRPIDLLKMIDLPEHVFGGTWTRNGDEIVSHPACGVRVMTPIALTGSYDVKLRFTRRRRGDSVMLVLPLNQFSCVCTVDSYDSKLSGLERVDWKFLPSLIGTGAGRRHEAPLATNDQEHTFRASVRQIGGETSIIAKLDNEEFVNWQGATNRLTIPGYATLPNPRSIAILTYQNEVTIHELTLELMPDAEGYALGKDWRNPLMNVADGPEEGSPYASLSKEWNGRRYYTSHTPLELGEAQTLAIVLKGRLVTISSPEENEFVKSLAGSDRVWTSTWCTTQKREWRDDRNRPMRFGGAWMQGQPDNILDAEGGQYFVQFGTGPDQGWMDGPARDRCRACIEWGEEYPDQQVPVKK